MNDEEYELPLLNDNKESDDEDVESLDFGEVVLEEDTLFDRRNHVTRKRYGGGIRFSRKSLACLFVVVLALTATFVAFVVWPSTQNMTIQFQNNQTIVHNESHNSDILMKSSSTSSLKPVSSTVTPVTTTTTTTLPPPPTSSVAPSTSEPIRKLTTEIAPTTEIASTAKVLTTRSATTLKEVVTSLRILSSSTPEILKSTSGIIPTTERRMLVTTSKKDEDDGFTTVAYTTQIAEEDDDEMTTMFGQDVEVENIDEKSTSANIPTKPPDLKEQTTQKIEQSSSSVQRQTTKQFLPTSAELAIPTSAKTTLQVAQTTQRFKPLTTLGLEQTSEASKQTTRNKNLPSASTVLPNTEEQQEQKENATKDPHTQLEEENSGTTQNTSNIDAAQSFTAVPIEHKDVTTQNDEDHNDTLQKEDGDDSYKSAEIQQEDLIALSGNRSKEQMSEKVEEELGEEEEEEEEIDHKDKDSETLGNDHEGYIIGEDLLNPDGTLPPEEYDYYDSRRYEDPDSDKDSYGY